MDERVPAVEILRIPVARLDERSALEEVARLYDEPGPAMVAYVNAHTLNLAYADPDYAGVLRGAGLILNDGAGLALAARLRGTRFPANLNGSDFNPKILEAAAAGGWRVFLVGGRPGVADRAAEALQARIGGLEVAGTHHGYFGRDEDPTVAARVRAAGAGLVMVAMGNPLQELWLVHNLAATGASLGVGVGAFLDFSAGEVPRAPRWMNRAGIEWVYRMGREPRRLWRRYLLGNPLFIARVLRSRRA